MVKIFLIFLFSYNPIFIYFFLKNGGQDALTFRITLSITIIIILSYITIYQNILKPQIQIPKISFTFITMNLIFIFYIIAISIGLIKYSNWSFIILDIFFYGEIFLGYYFFKFLNFETHKIDKYISYFGIYLFIMCVSSLSIYYYLTYIGNLEFGALRVYVSGSNYNRLADFIIPIFATPIFFYFTLSKSRIIHTIFIIFTIILCLLTFYRTVYLAVLVGCLVFLLQNFSFKKLIYLVSILLITILFLYNYDTQIINSIADRFITIFEAETKVSQSRSIRIDQLSYLVNMFDYFPLGYGVGGYINDYVISTGNQIIAYFLIFGPIAGILFLYVFIKSVVDSYLITREIGSNKISFLLISCSAILASSIVIVALFPYKYFPIHLLMGASIAIIEEISLRNNNYEK